MRLAMSGMALNHALDAVRSYLVDSMDRKGWDDQGTAELSEVIRSCIEGIGVTHRGLERKRRLALEEFRHAIAYVDEHLNARRRGDSRRY